MQPKIQQIMDVLDEALSMLNEYGTKNAKKPKVTSLQSNLTECLDLCQKMKTRDVEPVRTIHHLSCTGGTLITKCLAGMPNVLVLNEIDPLSTQMFNHEKPDFTPTDVISLIRQGALDCSEQVIEKVFIQSVKQLHIDLSSRGKRLLLRDHSHSHYLRGDEVLMRKSVYEMVEENFPVKSIVTVRDPIDSYLSLQHRGWVHFDPKTFDEYCRRYLCFLDDHSQVETFRYEDFVDSPEASMKEICKSLSLVYVGSFLETLDAFSFSGDSGRKGGAIERRPRRAMSEEMRSEIEGSAYYRELVSRLDYTHSTTL